MHTCRYALQHEFPTKSIAGRRETPECIYSEVGQDVQFESFDLSGCDVNTGSESLSRSLNCKCNAHCIIAVNRFVANINTWLIERGRECKMMIVNGRLKPTYLRNLESNEIANTSMQIPIVFAKIVQFVRNTFFERGYVETYVHFCND